MKQGWDPGLETDACTAQAVAMLSAGARFLVPPVTRCCYMHSCHSSDC
jgi:hypothetical protein